MRLLSSSLSVLLSTLLIVLPLSAETPLPAPEPTSVKATILQVRLEEPDSAAVPVNSTGNSGYMLQVIDAEGQPVANAAVALRLPDDGPTGTFANGSKSSVVYTDSKGQAQFQPVHWSSTAGTVVLRVTVVKGAAHAGALIQQSLILDAPLAKPAGTAVASSTPAEKSTIAPFPDEASPKTQAAAPSTSPEVPGTPVSPSLAASRSGAASTIGSPQKSSSVSPGVTVTTTSASSGTGGPVHSGSGSNNKKWVLLAVAVAGAGVGAFLAMNGHSAAPTTAGLTIGTPTLSVGH